MVVGKIHLHVIRTRPFLYFLMSGKKLRQLRKELGIPAWYVAEVAGVTPKQILAWEKGRLKPRSFNKTLWVTALARIERKKGPYRTCRMLPNFADAS